MNWTYDEDYNQTIYIWYLFQTFQNEFFMNSIDSFDKIEILINRYISLSEPNLNYINLIVNSQNLKLDYKTKFRASKKEREIAKSFFKENNGISYGVEIGISGEQLEPKSLKYNEENNSCKQTIFAPF